MTVARAIGVRWLDTALDFVAASRRLIFRAFVSSSALERESVVEPAQSKTKGDMDYTDFHGLNRKSVV